MSQVVPVSNKPSIIMTMAQRYEIDADELNHVIQATIMPPNATQAEFLALLMVANVYKLNPMTREIYAFPKKGGGIVPVVSIDGWIRIVNERPDLDGFEFEEHNDDNGKLVSVTCKIHRKGRTLPIVVTEYLDECIRQTEPWKMARRMLRHKSFIQCARYAFGFSGIYDEDEGLDMSGGSSGSRRGNMQTPKPPGSDLPAHDAVTGEIIDAEVRDVTSSAPPETAKPVEPEKQPDAVQAEKQPEDKPRAKRKPNGWAALLEEAKFAIEDGVCVKDTMGTYAPGDAVLPADQDDADLVLVDNVITRKPGEAKKETPVEAVVRMLNAAPDLIALDQVVTTDSKGKPTEGSKLYDKMSPEEKETVKEAYRRRKVELGGVPKTPPKGEAQQQDQQQGEASQQQSAEDEAATLLFGQIVKLFAEAKDTDTLDACMNQFDEQISDLPKALRDDIEDLYTKAQERLAEASAKGDGEQQGGDTGGAFGGVAEKDPASMTIDEYVAYAEAYIANAQSADWLKKRFFGENGIRQDLKLPNDISNRLRALRTAKGDELNAAGKV